MRLLLVGLVIALYLAGVAYGVWDFYHPYRGYTGRVMVEIPSGMGGPAIANLLVTQGVLAHKWPFLARYWIGRHRRRRASADRRP